MYEWVRVGVGSLAYDVEKRVWDFVGKRKRDGKLLRVVSSSCRMEMGDLNDVCDKWSVFIGVDNVCVFAWEEWIREGGREEDEVRCGVAA